ncbi:uncharacterized protein Z518_01369 [Rhinocladiella mackenziei CBS 650.93]|uniref:Rhinocladiella mackenziei CBS 650.93 unplaced genomic scaffold supercont1.1, whole genome shotgun sequence n=1 Tax=Rhinocladiella mackenziei CBS 650.93 TaxID=1442369 RepID=A0A0D2G5T3_9EURO|nr:uncharacterized protein Z518_01369 [Rhinocladiella mackenziei CBS 650.93]KIX10287.1 hypothetical protein Z518_01369 [Rhinocladiella mackenziei CBS 650.93]
MLGARARAAEYNAFKAASARQASREAEEQKLPPKLVPVSLSAFTKNSQSNRNKGAKAWVPLVLGDAPEDDNKSCKENEGTLPTPTHPTGSVDVTLSSNTTRPESETPLGPRKSQTTQMNVYALLAPTAPKAMVNTRDRSSTVFVNPTLQWAQQHSVIKQSQHCIPLGLHGAPSSLSGISQVSVPLFNPDPPFYNMMISSDISPTKQENKLALLSEEYGNPCPAFMPSRQQGLDSPGMIDTSLLGQMLGTRYPNEVPSWNSYQQIDFVPQNPIQRPMMPRVNSDGLMSCDTELAARFIRGVVRRHSHPESGQILLDRQGLADNVRQLTLQPPSRHEPYDGSSKIQHYVTTQQAMAKTDKTALHNPDLNRVKMSDVATPIFTESPETIPKHEPGRELNEGPGVLRPRTLLKPPPGFELRARNELSSHPRETSSFGSENDETLRKEFGVGTSDWCELKPVTKTQRIRMNKAMKRGATLGDTDTSEASLLNLGADRQQRLHKWLQADHRGNRATRKLVDQIVKDHLFNRFPNVSLPDGAVCNPNETSGPRIESAAIRAVGNILTNLTDPGESEGHGSDNGGLLYQYKPAPEYAIERGRLLTGNTGSTSFFEEEMGEFYNAPCRIARDPRFRPPSKEGPKPKSEDEWKRRRDPYGRRRL